MKTESDFDIDGPRMKFGPEELRDLYVATDPKSIDLTPAWRDRYMLWFYVSRWCAGTCLGPGTRIEQPLQRMRITIAYHRLTCDTVIHYISDRYGRHF